MGLNNDADTALPTTGTPVASSRVEMTEIVLPQHTNAIHSVFGGTVMSWVDTAAAACALRHCRKQVVTAAVDALQFVAPIRLGYIVIVRASVNFTAKTSCEVGVKVLAENPLTGDVSHTATAYLTMVSVDSQGKPVPMTPVLPQTEDEIRRYKNAARRRAERLRLRATLT